MTPPTQARDSRLLSLASDLHRLTEKIDQYLPNFKLRWNFNLLLKFELFIIIMTVIFLYLYRIQPYLVLTSQAVQEEQRINQEISMTLLKRYKEQLSSLESWWQDHVPPTTELSKIVDALNPTPERQVIGAIKVGEISAKDGYHEVQIETSFQGDYVTLEAWIKHIETFPFLIQIDKIELKPHPNEDFSKANIPSPPLLATVILRAILKQGYTSSSSRIGQ